MNVAVIVFSFWYKIQDVWYKIANVMSTIHYEVMTTVWNKTRQDDMMEPDAS